MNISPTSVEVVHDLTSFQELSACWNDLLRRSTADSPFLTWEWISSWVETYLHGDELRIILLRINDEPVALAPLWLDHTGWGPWRVRVFRLLGSTHVDADYLDFIVRQNGWKSHTREIWNYLFGRLRNEWDFLEFGDVPITSDVLRLLNQFADRDERCLLRRVTDTNVCPFMSVPSTFDAFLGNLPAKRRQSLNLTIRRLQDHGPLELRVCQSSQELTADMERLIKLRNRTWSERGFPGVCADDRFVEFQWRLAKRLLNSGTLKLCSLWMNSEHMAIAFAFVYKKVLYRYVSAVTHSTHARVNVGTALMVECVRLAISMECTEYDFLRGSEDYKYLWTNRERRTLKTCYFNSTLRSNAYLGSLAFVGMLKALGTLLLGSKRYRVKRWLLREDAVLRPSGPTAIGRVAETHDSQNDEKI